MTWKIPPNGRKFEDIFEAASLKHSLPPKLLARVAYQESRFRDDIIVGDVRSSANAVGIYARSYRDGIQTLTRSTLKNLFFTLRVIFVNYMTDSEVGRKLWPHTIGGLPIFQGT